MTKKEIFEVLPSFINLYEYIFKIEEAYNITVIKHSNKDVMKMGLYINTEDLYNYTHLVKVADKFILDCTYKRLFQRMYITKGEDNLPTEDSYAICYTPFGHTVMIDGLEAMILIKIMVMKYMGYKFNEETYAAYKEFEGLRKEIHDILN